MDLTDMIIRVLTLAFGLRFYPRYFCHNPLFIPRENNVARLMQLVPQIRLPFQAPPYWRLRRGKIVLAASIRRRHIYRELHINHRS